MFPNPPPTSTPTPSISSSSPKKFASPINAADNFGMTPLHHACAEGHVDVAVLLVKLGADVDRLDKNGQTPVQCASDDKLREVLRQAMNDAAHED